MKRGNYHPNSKEGGLKDKRKLQSGKLPNSSIKGNGKNTMQSIHEVLQSPRTSTRLSTWFQSKEVYDGSPCSKSKYQKNLNQLFFAGSRKKTDVKI